MEGEEYPGELVSFLKADAEHWKSIKVRGGRCTAVLKKNILRLSPLTALPS